MDGPAFVSACAFRGWPSHFGTPPVLETSAVRSAAVIQLRCTRRTWVSVAQVACGRYNSSPARGWAAQNFESNQLHSRAWNCSSYFGSSFLRSGNSLILSRTKVGGNGVSCNPPLQTTCESKLEQSEEQDQLSSKAPAAPAFIDDFLAGLADETANGEDEEELEDVVMTPIEHLEEFRQRTIRSGIVAVVAIGGLFTYITPLVKMLESLAPPTTKFLQLAPGEYLFATLKLSAYGGFLIASPYVLFEIMAFVAPGLRRSEKRVLYPILAGSALLFFGGLAFSYFILIPAAINFFVNFSGDAVEEMWSFDRYLDFVAQMFLSAGIASQIPIVQFVLGALGLVTSQQMLALWRQVVVAAMVLAAVLTPSTDPVTQTLLAGPLVLLYFGGIGAVKVLGR